MISLNYLDEMLQNMYKYMYLWPYAIQFHMHNQYSDKILYLHIIIQVCIVFCLLHVDVQSTISV